MVSAAQAEAFLVERFDARVQAISGVGHGEWSKAFTYALADRGDQYVVRFSALEEDFAKDRLAATYASPDLPIPAVIDLGQAYGGFYAISRRALGVHLDVLDGVHVRALLPALFRGLDAARRADVSTSVGYGIWGADGAAPHATWRDALLEMGNDRADSRAHGWRDRLAASPTGAGPFEQALGALQRLVDACPEQRCLVHSDLLNYNVVVADDRLTGVIDWGCSMYGDFLYDVAWLTFWAAWYPAWAGVDFAAEAARHYAAIGLDVPDLRARLQCYQVHIGLGGQAYKAFKRHWPELEAVARKTLEVAGQTV